MISQIRESLCPVCAFRRRDIWYFYQTDAVRRPSVGDLGQALEGSRDVIRHAGVTAAAVVVVVLGGCSSGSDMVRGQSAQAAPVTTTAAPSTSTTRPRRPPQQRPPPRQTAPPTRTQPWPPPLYKLSADSRALKSDPALAAVRSGVAGGLATSRKGVQVTRTAAYQTSVRNCTNVAQGLATTRAAPLRSTVPSVRWPRRGRRASARSAASTCRSSNVRRLAAGHGCDGRTADDGGDQRRPHRGDGPVAGGDSLAGVHEGGGRRRASRARGMVAAAAQIYAKTC